MKRRADFPTWREVLSLFSLRTFLLVVGVFGLLWLIRMADFASGSRGWLGSVCDLVVRTALLPADLQIGLISPPAHGGVSGWWFVPLALPWIAVWSMGIEFLRRLPRIAQSGRPGLPGILKRAALSPRWCVAVPVLLVLLLAGARWVWRLHDVKFALGLQGLPWGVVVRDTGGESWTDYLLTIDARISPKDLPGHTAGFIETETTVTVTQAETTWLAGFVPFTVGKSWIRSGETWQCRMYSNEAGDRLLIEYSAD